MFLRQRTAVNGTGEYPAALRFLLMSLTSFLSCRQTGYPYYDFSLSRSYKSVSTGKEGYSQNYFGKNEGQLLKVIQGATEWIAKAESQDQSDNAGALAA